MTTTDLDAYIAALEVAKAQYAKEKSLETAGQYIAVFEVLLPRLLREVVVAKGITLQQLKEAKTVTH